MEHLDILIKTLIIIVGGAIELATMMFGHIETIEERFDHLVRIRDVQALKPLYSKQNLSFMPSLSVLSLAIGNAQNTINRSIKEVVVSW